MDRPRRGPSILVKTPVEAFTENEYPPRCVEDGVAAKYDSLVANTKSFPSVEEKRVRVPDPSAFERVAVEPFVPEASDRRPPEGVARTSDMSRASARPLSPSAGRADVSLWRPPSGAGDKKNRDALLPPGGHATSCP